MEEIAVSKFKATCLAVIEQVRKTRKPVRITRFGKPLAEVVPPSTPDRPQTWLGSLAGTGTAPAPKLICSKLTADSPKQAV
jgi:prevent-host-death family protein